MKCFLVSVPRVDSVDVAIDPDADDAATADDNDDDVDVDDVEEGVSCVPVDIGAFRFGPYNEDLLTVEASAVDVVCTPPALLPLLVAVVELLPPVKIVLLLLILLLIVLVSTSSASASLPTSAATWTGRYPTTGSRFHVRTWSETPRPQAIARMT